MKKITHQLVLALLTALFVTLSLGWFTPAATSYMKQDVSFIQLHLESGATASVLDASATKHEARSGDELLSRYQVISGDSTGASISFPGGVSARLAPSTQVEILASSANVTSALLLVQGEVWINSVGSVNPLTVYVPEGAMASSDNNAFDVVSKDGGLNIFAAKNPVRTALFLPFATGAGATHFSPADVRPLNSILVTEGNQLDVLLSRIQPKLEKLLYSKLVKEFQYRPLSDADIKKNNWFQLNYQLDATYRDMALSQLIGMVKGQNTANPDPSNPLSFLYSGFHSLRGVLTLSTQVRQQNAIQYALSYLDDAIYLFTVSQTTAASDRMSYFSSLVSGQASNHDFITAIDDALWSRFQRFSLLVPQDGALFALKSTLRDELLKLNQTGYHLSFDRASRLVRSSLYDVYSALNFDSIVTDQLFKEYIDGTQTLFAMYSDDISKNPQVLAEENQLLSQLYLRSPLFYKESYFAQKLKIESEWLKLLPDGVDKQEENQTLIAAKIDLIKQLRSYFFDEKIELADARSVMFMLLSDITAATNASSDIAAVQLFKDSLKLQQSFWKYLNSSEFADSTVHGQTNKDRFVAFVKNVADQQEIDSIQKGLLGTIPLTSQESRQTLLDIQRTFVGIGVTKLNVSPLLDKDQQQVFITSAEYNGVPFSAIYDRDSALISDVKVYNETVLSSAVPLSQLKNIFKPKTGNGTDLLAGTTDTTSSSLLGSFDTSSVEKVAKLFIVKKFTDLGFTITIDNVQTTNYQTKIFQLTGIQLPFDKNPISLSFSLDLKSNTISQVSLSVLGQSSKMTGEFPIEGFADAVKVFYENQFYQKVASDVAIPQ
ncbi:MAG: hypothetical protein NTX63_04090 [Candidatus Peregrinibacteria bacterium]|nr:hypothetical protein [Candidatus Peregrinibacteria bacterium]